MSTRTKAKSNSKSDSQKRDKFGSRIGTDCSKVNAILSRKPMTEPQLREKAGVKNSVEYHLDKLVRLGILKWKEDEGYFLK